MNNSSSSSSNGGSNSEARNRRLASPDRGEAQGFISVFETRLSGSIPMGEPMTPEKAYEMGFRHIIDLAEMNKVAAMVENDRLSAAAVKLMEAWREGALAATAMLERQSTTLQ